MTLRRKGMLTIFLAMTATIVISFIVSQTILMRRFDQLEREETARNVGRAVSALYSDFSKVSIASGSELTPNTVVIDGEETYIRLNVDPTTFHTLGVNYILFARTGQQPLGYGLDPENGTPLPIPADLTALLSGDGPLIQPPQGQAAVTGILKLSDGPLLIASYPTVVSIDGMPLDGRLVLARCLNQTEIQRLSDVTHLSLTLYELGDSRVPDKVNNLELAADSNIPTYVQALGRERIAGYCILTGIYNQPVLVLQVDMPRDIHHQGQTTMLYLLCAIAGISIVSGVAINLVVDRSIVLRMLRLSNGVVKVRTTGDLSQRIEVTGDDELTSLSMTINSMLASLEKSQKELRDSEAQNRALIKGIPDFMLRIGKDGTILEAKSAKGGDMLEPHKQIHGRMLYKPLKEYRDLTREVVSGSLQYMDAALKTGEAQIFEFKLAFDSHEYFYEVRLVANEKQGELLCVVFDVTQRHEEAQKKEILIKEIHHRVKNNLQVVSSLLYLQSTRVNDQKITRMFEESANRVKSISLIHEKLYKERLQPQNEAGNVDFSDYVRDLTDALFTSFGVDRKIIRLICDTSGAFLSLDAAIPCGLIVNELVSNSLKYAFPEGRTGEIRVSLYGDAEGRMTLTVSDNGIGLPSDLDVDTTSSLGLRLVTMLAQQLGAEVRLNRNKGTEFKFIFTDAKKKEKTPVSEWLPRQSAGAEPVGAKV